ncbi:unnamed protein product [Urochloa humidicola]
MSQSDPPVVSCFSSFLFGCLIMTSQGHSLVFFCYINETHTSCAVRSKKFQHISDEFIDRVVNQGDMTCVAGGLKLTHPSVVPFIKELVGTADSVRGLPRELTEKLIRESLEAKEE